MLYNNGYNKNNYCYTNPLYMPLKTIIKIRRYNYGKCA